MGTVLSAHTGAHTDTDTDTDTHVEHQENQQTAERHTDTFEVRENRSSAMNGESLP